MFSNNTKYFQESIPYKPKKMIIMMGRGGWSRIAEPEGDKRRRRPETSNEMNT
jgi:hypothetical protein